MTLQVTCPVCAAAFPMTAGLNDAEARRFAVLMGELPPPIARLMPDYLALFKPLKQGLRWPRLVKLLAELLPEITAGEITRNARTLKAPAAVWVAALEATIGQRAALTLPLDGHGYLRSVVAGMADKAAGQAEQRREQALRTGESTRRDAPVKAGEFAKTAIDPAKQRDGIKALREKTGL